MKKALFMLMSLCMTLGLVTGCNNKADSAESSELIVFAAASMTETLTELGNTYMAEHPEVNIQFNFDSSGTLKTQIEEGADCDIFISAGQKQMDQLDISADSEINTDGLDFVLEGTRFDILENKVALAVPEGNPANIQSYDDLQKGLSDGTILLAMGNSDVPVGQYTQKILDYFGLDEESLAQAVDTLSSISEADRLIGIISHRKELEDYISDRIVVERSADGAGSTVRIEKT